MVTGATRIDQDWIFAIEGKVAFLNLPQQLNDSEVHFLWDVLFQPPMEIMEHDTAETQTHSVSDKC